MKTTTEKRSRTVQFNLDDDHEDKDADSQTNPFATNGKKSKVENSRMRYVYARNSNISNSLISTILFHYSTYICIETISLRCIDDILNLTNVV